MLFRTRNLAYRLHGDQVDKSGHPYYEHLDAVCAGVQVLGGGIFEQVAALLHDSVEDVEGVTIASLRAKGVPEQSLDIIAAMSHAPGQPYAEYIDQVIAAGPGACRVKAADLMHNTRHDRMAELDPTVQARLRSKYQPALRKILIMLELIPWGPA